MVSRADLAGLAARRRRRRARSGRLRRPRRRRERGHRRARHPDAARRRATRSSSSPRAPRSPTTRCAPSTPARSSAAARSERDVVPVGIAYQHGLGRGVRQRVVPGAPGAHGRGTPSRVALVHRRRPSRRRREGERAARRCARARCSGSCSRRAHWSSEAEALVSSRCVCLRRPGLRITPPLVRSSPSRRRRRLLAGRCAPSHAPLASLPRMPSAASCFARRLERRISLSRSPKAKALAARRAGRLDEEPKAERGGGAPAPHCRRPLRRRRRSRRGARAAERPASVTSVRSHGRLGH